MSGRKFPDDARQRHATSRVEQLISGDCSIQSWIQSGREATSWELMRGSEAIAIERSAKRDFDDGIFQLKTSEGLLNILLILDVQT